MAESVPDAQGYYHVGPHRFRFEPPDIVHIYFRGDVDIEHFDEFFDVAMRFAPDRPIYILRDARAGGILTAKARARMIKIVQPNRVAALVSYGASFQARIVMTMLTKAMRTFRLAAPGVAFLDSESAARTWITTHRLQTRRAASP